MHKLLSRSHFLMLFSLFLVLSTQLSACGTQRLPPEMLAEQLGQGEIFLIRPGEVQEEALEEAANIEAYFQYRFDQMKDSGGTIPDGALMAALATRAEMEAAQKPEAPADIEVAGIDSGSWTAAGPGNIGGRIRAVLPIDASTVFIGGVSGGIWKTTNCCTNSTTWTAVNDFMANLAISSLIVDPTNANVMYAGTGEGFGNADAVRGAGVFKSTDGGTTWAQLANTNNASWYYVNRLAISPDGVNLIAATGSGLYHSTDGGVTWAQRLSGNWKDVRFDPTNSNNAVAAGSGYSWYTTGGGGSGTWAAATGLPASGRIELAYAPSNPLIVYASVEQSTGAIYKSTDGGHTYALVNAGAGFQTNQGWYDNTIWVNPTDPNNVVAGGLDLYMSTDGAMTFTKISAWTESWPNFPASPHADHHALVSIPGSSTALLNGNDGGLYYTSDIATAGNNSPDYNNGWVSLNNNLGITQFYGVAGNANGVLYGGAQDNGVSKYTPGAPNAWTFANGGDGGKSAADPTNPNYLYNEYIYGTVNRSSDGGTNTDDIYGTYWNGSTWTCRNAPYRIDDACNSVGNFIAPILLDPNNPNRLLVGGLSLWVTDDARTPYVFNSSTAGPQWAAIKPSIVSSAVNAIAVAPGNSDIIWMGYKNGQVDMTTNGGSSWSTVTITGSPGTMVSSIAIDRNDNNVVYVGFTGFGTDRIFRTANGGGAWSSISSNLPQAPIYAIAINPSNSAWLYVGTEIGLFASENTGTSWNVPVPPTNGDGPANVAIFDLQWVGGGNSTGNTTLIAGTHGRGAYFVDTIPDTLGNTYADPAQFCAGNSPCYATIIEAIDNVILGGTATIYAGTYGESVSLNKAATVSVAGNITINNVSIYNGATWNAGSAAITANNVNIFGGTWNAGSSTLTVNGDWTVGGTFNVDTGMVVFAKNGTVTLSNPAQVESTLSFCNLTISANTLVDVTDDFISAATGGSCTQYIQNGQLRREAPQQWVANAPAFTFKDGRNRDAVILQRQSGNNLLYTNITITSNQLPPLTCGASSFPGTAVLRQFDLTASGTPPYGPYRMRLYFSANSPDESNGNTVVAPYNLAIYHCTGTNWEKFPGFGGSDANGVFVETTVATWSTGATFAIGYSGTVYYSQGSLDAGLTTSWNSARDGSGSQPANFTDSDIFVIQNGHSMTTASAWTLSNTGSLLQIESGGALAVNTNNLSLMGAQIDAGSTLTINSGRTFTVNNGSLAPDLTVNGTVFNAGTITSFGTIAFGAGSVYQHAMNGGVIPTATWNATSTVNVTGTTATVPGGLGQSFGHLTWNSPAQTANTIVGSLTVNGNLTFLSTNTGSILLNSTTNIGGNLTMSGGRLYLSYSGTPVTNVGGNVNVSGGTLITNWPLATPGIPTLNVAGDWTYTAGTFTPNQGTVNFTKNGVATVSSSAAAGTLTFCNLTISANTLVDVTDDFLNAATGGSCTTYTQNGQLRREAPTQNVNTTGIFTFKDGRNRDSVILQKLSGNNLDNTSITITSNQQPPVCGTTLLVQPVLRRFDLTATGGSTPFGPYRMRLYFSPNDPSETNSNTSTPPYNLAIYHCDGSSWEKFTGTGGSDANGVYLETTLATWSAGSTFAIGADTNTPVPPSPNGGDGPGGVGTTDGTSSLVLWLRADQGLFSDTACTTPATNTGDVACWQDQSGNARNYTQSTAANQPNYFTNILNNHPVVRLNGSSDYLTNPGSGGAVLAAGDDTFTYLATWMSNISTNLQVVFEQNNVTLVAGMRAAFLVVPGGSYGFNGEANDFHNATPFTTGQFELSSIVLNGNASNNVYVFDSGTESIGTINITTQNVGTTGGSAVGYKIPSNSEYLNGDLPEVIVFSDALNDVNRILVENYMSARYGIALNANDVYDGDTFGSGDFDLDVAGIGRFGGNQHTQAHSAGMIVVNGTFLTENGDWLLFGHRTLTNSNVTTELPSGGGWDGLNDVRWARHWYIDVTDPSGNTSTVNIIFDFSEAGMGGVLPDGPASNYRLLKRSSAIGTDPFTDITALSGATVVIAGDQVQFWGVEVAELGSNFTLGSLDVIDSPTALSLSTFSARTPALKMASALIAMVFLVGLGWVSTRRVR